ncbi:hypothetical protein [Mycobacterium phage CELFI]|uniref:Uncharacterized protein n=1 Tax=Mycobacterium phage CELFI TaxID=2769359 RepID=A0A7G9V4C3_9CAUD|nr:hypothetical protein J4T95_gp120 [Mycobacterium phage CELFI]QNO01129.1 hypothetical protein [Mycobacterium phage CELFI]
MSTEFWLGMACIPVVVALLALMAAAIMGLIYASSQWDFGTYKLWPHRTKPEVIAATVACAKSRRYLWIPGWHVVICRTTLFNRDDAEDIERHRKVQWAVRDALNVDPFD